MHCGRCGGIRFFIFLRCCGNSTKNEADQMQPASPVVSSPGQFLFYRCVRTVTHHLRPVSFYFTDESEPSLVIVQRRKEVFFHLVL